MERSFVDILVKKLAFAKELGERESIVTNALQEDVQRQIKQVSLTSNGNPITGEGATKSGKED